MQQETDSLPFIAYEIHKQSDMAIFPAPIARDWMDATQQRFAYRCLPLTIANQAGWIIANPSTFTARWNGGASPADTVLTFDREPPDNRITSLFGHGVVTFNLPYLMRTPPGYNLWVRGPTNWPKDGLQALDGIVETDWTAATFTMNWKLTRPNNMITFERGEPICMVFPFPRDLLENCKPQLLPLSDNKELQDRYQEWSRGRDNFHDLLAAGDKEAVRAGWQKDYFQGRDPGVKPYDQHQTKLFVRPFDPAPDR